MTDIPTWHERAMAHPDHQNGMISEGMIRARMCEEIADLRAEIERQARHIEELRDKIDAEKSCCCSFDALGDVCAAHSPALTQALAEVERLTRERDEARAEVEAKKREAKP